LRTPGLLDKNLKRKMVWYVYIWGINFKFNSASLKAQSDVLMARNFPRQAYPKAYCGAPKVLGDERTH
jgi:hypothetical protein